MTTDHQTARDPHEVLGVSPGADRQEVLRAFQHRVRRGGHPDTGGDARTFHEIIRARDTLLGQAQHSGSGAQRSKPDSDRDTARQATSQGTAQATPEAEPTTQRTPSPPPRTSAWAIATGVLALLGPFFWPLAIAVGFVARRRVKRTGLGGGTAVSMILFVLCFLTLPVLVRILSVIAIP